MDVETDPRWLERAVGLAVENVAEGGGPFGAVVVAADGTLLGEGANRVTRDLDPTAHAEIVAIRAACRAVGDFALAGATVFASCEPCPMCLATALWARVDRVVFAADRLDAARVGFDDAEFHDLFARDRSTWDVRIEAVPLEHATAPFDAWLAHPDRTEY